MTDNDALIQIVNRGVACLVDNSDVPRQAPYIPYNPAHLRGAPAADISNEEIQHLIDAGLAKRSEPYNGCYNVLLTFLGHRRNLELEGWFGESHARWQKQYARYLCCAEAIPGRCVCVVMTRCPHHGVRCNGSHD